MAVLAGSQSSYHGGFLPGTGGNREDLIDLVVNVDPHDTPFFTVAPKTVARHVYHEWLTDTLAAASTAGSDEGADFSVSAMTNRSRVANWTQIFRKDILVTQTQRAVDPAGVQDEYAHQIMKALKEIARNIEKTIFDAAGQTATASGSTRRMKTLQDFITTNSFQSNAVAIGGTSNTASNDIIKETPFNGLLEEIFNDGGNPDTVYVNAKGKRQISQFITNTSVSRNIALADKKLINAVDVYESDFGLVQIVLDRWVPVVTGTGTATATDMSGQAFFLERGMVRIAVLRPIKHVPLPPNGDSARGIVLGELTLEVGNEKALGRMTGIRDSLTGQ